MFFMAISFSLYSTLIFLLTREYLFFFRTTEFFKTKHLKTKDIPSTLTKDQKCNVSHTIEFRDRKMQVELRKEKKSQNKI